MKILKTNQLLEKSFSQNGLNDDYRMYFVSYDNPFFDTFDGHIDELSDEQFVSLAEEEGQIYTLSGFQNAFNLEDAPSDVTNFVRILPKNVWKNLSDK